MEQQDLNKLTSNIEDNEDQVEQNTHGASAGENNQKENEEINNTSADNMNTGATKKITKNLPGPSSTNAAEQGDTLTLQENTPPLQANMPPLQDNISPLQDNVPPLQDNIPPIQDNVPPLQEDGPPENAKETILRNETEIMKLKKQRIYYEISLIYEQIAMTQRKKYKMELELLKMERGLNIIVPSDFTRPYFNQLAGLNNQ